MCYVSDIGSLLCYMFCIYFLACDSCVHILLDDVEALQRSTTNLSTTLESVSVGMSANNRLEEINQAAINLRVRQPFSGGTLCYCLLLLGYF